MAGGSRAPCRLEYWRLPRRRSLRRLARFVLLIAACALQATSTAAQDQEPAEVKQRLESVRAEIQRLQQAREATSAKRQSLFNELAAVERRVNELAAALRKAEQRRERLEQRLQRLAGQRAEMEAELQHKREQLTQQLRTAYLLGRRSRLRLLLNLENPQRLSRLLAYHDYFAAARSRQLRDLQTRIEELAALRADIHRRRAELREVERRRQADLDAQQRQQRRRGELLEATQATLTELDQRLTELRRNREDLETLLEKLERAIPAPTDIRPVAFDKLKHRLRWPVEGKVLAGFGTRRAGDLDWSGMLIRTEPGDPVRAVAAGRVVFADWLRGFGLLIIVDHGDGYMSLYGYNDSLLYTTGDWVSAGESIATAGSSGARGSALYFELRHRGAAFNPAPWLRAR